MLVSTMRGHAAAAKTTMLLVLIPLAMTASDFAEKQKFCPGKHATVVAGILQRLPEGFYDMMVDNGYIRNPDAKDGYIIQQPITISPERLYHGDRFEQFNRALSEVPEDYIIDQEDGGKKVYVTLNEARRIDQICDMTYYSTRRPKDMKEFTEPAFYQHTQGLMSVIYGIDREKVLSYGDTKTRRHLKTILLSSPLEKQNYYLSKEQITNSKQNNSTFKDEKDEDWAKNRGYPTDVYYPARPLSTVVPYQQFLDEVLQVPQAVKDAQQKAHGQIGGAGRLILSALAQPEQYKKTKKPTGTKRKSPGSPKDDKADKTYHSADYYTDNNGMQVDPCADCTIL